MGCLNTKDDHHLECPATIPASPLPSNSTDDKGGDATMSLPPTTPCGTPVDFRVPPKGNPLESHRRADATPDVSSDFGIEEAGSVASLSQIGSVCVSDDEISTADIGDDSGGSSSRRSGGSTANV